MSKAYFAMMDRFTDFNVLGLGKDSGHCDEYHWKGRMLWQHEWCMQRWVKLPDGVRVRLIKHAKSKFNAGKGMAGKGMTCETPYLSYFVPDLGVFSSFEGDFLPEDQLHRRQGYIMTKQIETYPERAMKRLTGSLLMDVRAFKAEKELMEALCQRYDKYRKLFALEWPDLDMTHLAHFIDLMTEKRDRYMDPKSTAQRERKKARELAKKTLGL